jgi:hypothetical protein
LVVIHATPLKKRSQEKSGTDDVSSHPLNVVGIEGMPSCQMDLVEREEV